MFTVEGSYRWCTYECLVLRGRAGSVRMSAWCSGVVLMVHV